MSLIKHIYCLLLVIILFPCTVFAGTINIPILCYHNLNPTVPGIMNMTPKKFESQIKWLKDNGFNIIPLTEVVEYLQGTRASLPPKAIVVTVDDGWASVYHYMLPVARKYNVPMTLFIYPQTISDGTHAMTWDQLKELQNTGLFDIQSHTYGHPNFKQAKKRLSAAVYERFVKAQLVEAKQILEKKLGTKVTLLAWPFGIYDAYLEQEAAKAGYTMAFSIDARDANRTYKPMAQPRFMIVDGLSMQTFQTIANSAKEKKE